MKDTDFIALQAFGRIPERTDRKVGAFIDVVVVVLWLVFFLVAA